MDAGADNYRPQKFLRSPVSGYGAFASPPSSASASSVPTTAAIALDTTTLLQPEQMDRLGKAESRGSKNWSSPSVSAHAMRSTPPCLSPRPWQLYHSTPYSMFLDSR